MGLSRRETSRKVTFPFLTTFLLLVLRGTMGSFIGKRLLLKEGTKNKNLDFFPNFIFYTNLLDGWRCKTQQKPFCLPKAALSKRWLIPYLWSFNEKRDLRLLFHASRRSGLSTETDFVVVSTSTLGKTSFWRSLEPQRTKAKSPGLTNCSKN